MKSLGVGPSSKVSLIVTSHNQLHYSKIMYESLRRYTHYPYELIWVDSASTDGTREWLKKLDNITPVLVGKMGVGEAMLNGFAKCDPESEYIGDFDNDLILTDGWLARLIIHMKENPEFGAIATKSSAAYRGIIRFTPDKKRFNESIQAFARKIADQSTGLMRVDWVNGSHTLYRRKAIEQVGLWDPRLWRGEDKDISIRLNRKGWRTAYANNTWVYHFLGRTTKQIDKQDADWRKHREESIRLLKQLYSK